MFFIGCKLSYILFISPFSDEINMKSHVVTTKGIVKWLIPMVVKVWRGKEANLQIDMTIRRIYFVNIFPQDP